MTEPISTSAVTSPDPARVLSHETRPAEHFIPIRYEDLVELLAADERLSVADERQLRVVANSLRAIVHHEYHEELERLKRAYAPFDPDADTETLHPVDDQLREQRSDELFEQFTWLLERANYRRLSREQIESTLNVASDWGFNLDVDLDVFHQLEIFSRGETVCRRSRRRLRTRYRLEEVDLPVFKRLVIIYRTRPHKRLRRLDDSNTIHLKIFKNIPTMDLEMLLPGTRVKMSILDRSKIALPILSGTGITVAKMVNTLLLASKASVLGPAALLGLVGGSFGYGFRSFMGYVRTKERYQLNLTESLYYQNLDSNAGVLYRLLDAAEEQDARETLLAYFFLWQHAGESGLSHEQLDEEVEQFLSGKLTSDVDFEVGDSLKKLERFGLLESPVTERVAVAAPSEAARQLSRLWCGYQPASATSQRHALHRHHPSAVRRAGEPQQS